MTGRSILLFRGPIPSRPSLSRRQEGRGCSRPGGASPIAALQPDANFGRVLAAYGGVFIVGSLLWGVIFDGFRPDRYDISGAVVCLVGVVVIMYAPR